MTAMSDEEAWQVVQDNLGLGYKLAARFYMSRKRYGQIMGGTMHDELRSAAPMILFKAAKGFDPQRGYKFSTYAGTALWRGFLTIEKYEKRRQTVDYDDSRVYKDRGLDTAEVVTALADVGLTDRDRDILWAYFVEGLTKKETAAYVGTTPGIVKRTVEKKIKTVAPNLDPDDLRPEPQMALAAPRKSRRVHLPHDEAEPEPGEVRVTPGQSTMTGSILDQIRQDPEIAAKRQRNREQAEAEAKLMERWYADLRRERE